MPYMLCNSDLGGPTLDADVGVTYLRRNLLYTHQARLLCLC